jgi:ankyrin repeat protein
VKKCRKSYRVANGAASGGHLELLKYLREKKWKFGNDAPRSAARNGHLECLKYLIEEVNFDYRGFDARAAIHGHLNILQYYVDSDLEKRYYACDWAAENGQLEALKFLHENGWSWDARTLEYARKKGHWDCYNYAKEHGCPGR